MQLFVKKIKNTLQVLGKTCKVFENKFEIAYKLFP